MVCSNLNFNSKGTIEHLSLRLTMDKIENSSLPFYMQLRILTLSLTVFAIEKAIYVSLKILSTLNQEFIISVHTKNHTLPSTVPWS